MYKIGICDDEKNTCEKIKKIICEYAKQNATEIEVFVWYTGEALLAEFETAGLDLLFLDIELVTTNGIEVGRYIRNELENHEIGIAYISSKSSYAMALFKIRPIDFLIKPIQYEDVAQIIDEALKISRRKKLIFEYHAKGVYGKVKYQDIFCFSSDNKKINLILADSVITFNARLKDLLPALPENFLQIHQSHIINLDHLAECAYDTVTMSNGQIFNISQPYRKEVRRKIAEFNWG